MNLLESKIEAIIYVIILAIVIVTLIANSMPNIASAFTNLSNVVNGSGEPATQIGFASFFQSGGLIYLLLGLATSIIVIRLIMGLTHTGKK